MTFMSFYYGVVVALQRVLADGCDVKQKIDNIQHYNSNKLPYLDGVDRKKISNYID